MFEHPVCFPVAKRVTSAPATFHNLSDATPILRLYRGICGVGSADPPCDEHWSNNVPAENGHVRGDNSLADGVGAKCSSGRVSGVPDITTTVRPTGDRLDESTDLVRAQVRVFRRAVWALSIALT